MGNFKKAIVLLILFGAFCLTAHASEGALPSHSYDPFGKLFSGLGNIVESPLEFGCQTREVFHDSASESVARLFKATGLTLRRLGVGIFEVATFIFPGEVELEPYCDTYYNLPI